MINGHTTHEIMTAITQDFQREFQVVLRIGDATVQTSADSTNNFYATLDYLGEQESSDNNYYSEIPVYDVAFRIIVSTSSNRTDPETTEVMAILVSQIQSWLLFNKFNLTFVDELGTKDVDVYRNDTNNAYAFRIDFKLKASKSTDQEITQERVRTINVKFNDAPYEVLYRGN